MTAGRCRRWIAACADAPVSRSGWCLVCHFAAVAADEFKTCVQYRQVAHGLIMSRKPCFLLHLYAIIRPAFVRASRIFKRRANLGPDYGRVTTALRGVVTRPLAHSNRCASRFPVTKFAMVWVIQGGLVSITTGFTSLNRDYVVWGIWWH